MSITQCTPCCDPSGVSRGVESFRQAELIVLCQILEAVQGGGGGGTPGGGNLAVQYNDAGTFGGDNSFFFEPAENTLIIDNGHFSVTRSDGTNINPQIISAINNYNGHVDNIAFYGQAVAAGPNTNIGIYAEAANGGVNWAAFFRGNLHVEGDSGFGTQTPNGVIDAVGHSVFEPVETGTTPNALVDFRTQGSMDTDGVTDAARGSRVYFHQAGFGGLCIGTDSNGYGAIQGTDIGLDLHIILQPYGENVGIGGIPGASDRLDVHGNARTRGTHNADDYSVGGAAGASGNFTTTDLKTVTVVNGIITSIV